MSRNIYFLSLLLFINISFCYDYLSYDELNPILNDRKYQVGGRKYKGKVNRKFQINEMIHDKRPLAQIDVVSFIQNPDESSLNDKIPYESYKNKLRQEGFDYVSGSFINTNDETKKDTEYQNFEPDNIIEVNRVNDKHFVPQNMILNRLPTNELNSHKDEQTGIKRIEEDFPFNSKLGHISRTEKKCALKNMKIPFFSHDKVETTKETKSKKRKLFGFRKFKKQSSSISNQPETNSHSNSIRPTYSPQNIYNINKRSYFEKLCPLCKQKFFAKSNSDLLDERQKNSENIIHNSRQCYQKNGYNPKIVESDKPSKFGIQPNSLENSIDLENSMKDRRWKRGYTTVEENEKKVLQEIQKKVDTVKINKWGD